MLDLPRHRAREEGSPRRQVRPPLIDGHRIVREIVVSLASSFGAANASRPVSSS